MTQHPLIPEELLTFNGNYPKAPFDPLTLTTPELEEKAIIDENYPFDLIITDSPDVFPKTRMPKRKAGSAFSDELNDYVDLAFAINNWYKVPEFTFPMWDRVNQPQNYEEHEIMRLPSDDELQVLFFDAFKRKLFTYQEFLNCCKERNDGHQYWYFKTNEDKRDIMKMSDITIENS